MKNLTRVLVLALVFSMLLTSVAFGATFTDVEDGTAIAEATDVLAGLGILKGYEDGSFGPDKVITRAEVVAVANRLQGLSTAAQAAAGSTIYTDVAADAWYAGDVNLATQMGIIAGDGNGLFRPEDSVKYEEAVKIMVAALGYQPNYVMAKGGWPTGYLVIASEAGVTKGLSGTAGQDAYRGIVARLAYNALNAPMMVQDGYNSDGTFQYKTVKDAQLSYDKLGVLKIDIEVKANATTSTTLKSEEITATIKGHYNDADGKLVKFDNYGAAIFASNPKFLVGTTNIADFYGYTVTAFVEENDEGNWVVKAFTVPANMNNAVEIADATKIMLTTATKYPSVVGTPSELSVYDDEVDTTNTTYELASSVTVVTNGSPATAAAPSAGMINALPVVGSVELLDNNNDGAYDYIFVTTYVTDVVTEVYSQNKKIGTKNAVLDLTNAIEGKKGYAYTMTLDGEAIEPADLKEDDVISWSVDAGYKNYKILVSRETITGAVEETDTTTYAGTPLKYVYVIDGENYGIANVYGGATTTAVGLNNVVPGDEGIAYIDAFGKIAMFDKTTASSDNYAFIVNVGDYTNVGETAYEIQLFTKDGELVTYTLADKVKVADNAVGSVSGTPGTRKLDDKLTAANAYAYITGYDKDDNAVASVSVTENTTTYDYATLGLTLGLTVTDNSASAYAGRIVTYKANSNGYLTAIEFPASYNSANNSNEFDVVMPSVSAGSEVQLTYTAKTGSFDTFAVTDDTIIFNIPAQANKTKEDLAIETKSSLADDADYNVAFFGIDKDTDAIGAMIVTNDPSVIGADDNLAIFLKAMKASTGDEEIYKITFMQGGEVKELATDVDFANADEFVDGTVTNGALFAYATTPAGDIKDYTLISNVTTGSDMYSTYYANWVNLATNRGPAYEFGYVQAKGEGTITLANLAVTGSTADFGTNVKKRAIDKDAVYTIIDLNKVATNASRIKTGAFAEIQKTSFATDGKLADAERDFAVFLKYVDDEVVDVVIIKGAAANILGVASH